MKPYSVLLLIIFLHLTENLAAFPEAAKELIIVADKKTFSGGKKVEIGFKPKTIQFIIDASGHHNEKLVYEIKMEGITDPYVTSDPVARYTFLPGGEHHFKYRVIENGVFSPWYVQEINIKRGIIEMPWFYPALIVYLVLVLGAITYFWIIYNLRQNLKLQTLRSKISANLHDETGSTLSSISLDLGTLESLLPTENEKLHNLITETRNTAEEAILKLRDTLWSIQPEHDDMLNLAGRIGQSASKMFAFKKVQLEFSNELSEADNFQIAMERRGDILHIAKEALNNCLKHAHASKVKLRLAPIKNGIQMSIVDDGSGFNVKEPHAAGNGLRYFQQRAKNSFLEVEITSKPGEGTMVSVDIPKL
ncbi:sensor histidine kinase [Haliscomenobacter sp.]|uniref:sensor histidine kinase n=1 Tax=Haliscomenobacter sp. TaxID=2717303 RepID=UPI003593565B